MDITQLADGVIRIAVAKMAGAVHEVSVHRGFDPRDFALLGFGGAGPMHVFLVAEELAVPQVIVPRFPGHLSALGQLLADQRHDAVRPWGGRLSALDPADLEVEAAQLRQGAEKTLTGDGFDDDRQSHSFTIDMRYAGQSFTLAVPLDADAPDWDTLRSAFAERHTQTFGHADMNNECEIVNIRLVSLGIVDKPALAFTSDIPASSDPILEHRKAWFGTGWTDCPIYDRAKMASSLTITGPAIIEESGGTSVVPPDWTVTVHDSGTLICQNPVAG